MKKKKITLYIDEKADKGLTRWLFEFHMQHSVKISKSEFIEAMIKKHLEDEEKGYEND